MVRLGPAMARSWAGKPAHMVGRDLGLWMRWRQKLPYPYEALYFDVAVSASSPPPPTPETPMSAAWWFLLAKRIDVVGELPDRWDLIELRRGAGQAALGALRLYRHLWIQDPPDERPVHMILVTDAADPDIRSLAELDGIELIELGT